jgi:16S rRNA processing protein RimM
MQPENEASEFVVVGKFGAPHGVRGLIKVISSTEIPDAIMDYQPWYIEEEGEWQILPLTTVGLKGQQVMAEIDGITDRDEVKEYTGCEIAVPYTALPKVAEGEYYWADLEGLTVITETGQILGLIDHIFNAGASDVIVVEGEGENQRYLIPFVQGDTVKSIDLAEKTMIVNWDPEI